MGGEKVMTRGKVSIIVPCFNHGHYLKQTLESVARSTYPNVEVIVIDDGSTSEETKSEIEKLRGMEIKGREVRFIRQLNQGLPATRNNGIQMTDGEYILALDADDMIEPTYLEKSIWVLTRYPNVSIVYPSFQHFGIQNDIWSSRPYDFSALLHDNYMAAGSVYRRTVWEGIGGYDEQMKSYEDWDFWIRAGARGYHGYWLPEPLFYYRKAESSMLVWAHQRRKQLIRQIRTKNKLIFRKCYRRPLKDRSRSLLTKFSSPLRKKFPSLKWKIFTLYVKLSKMLPQRLREKGKRLVKPVIRRIFSYPETFDLYRSLTASQSDELSPVSYVPNDEYIELVLNGVIKKNMSILFILPWMKVGGVDKVHLDLTEKFTAEGHNVHIFTTVNSDHAWYSRFSKITPHVTRMGNWFELGNREPDYLLDYIAAHQIDVIHISNSQMGYELSAVIKYTYPWIKIVDLLHSEAPQEPWDYFRFSTKFRTNLDKRIVLTQQQKRAMVRKYGETDNRVEIIQNGVSVPDTYNNTNYCNKMESEDFVIGFVGRFSHEKQPITFLRIAKDIVTVEPKIKFIMIGDGPEYTQAKKLISSLHLEGNVELLGHRDDVLTIIKSRIHLLVGPSLYEGLPIVGLEALSHGIPIIATAVSGWVDLIQHGQTGYLLDVGNNTQMAKSCLKLFNDRKKRQEFSRAGYEFAKEKYSLQNMVDAYLGLYGQLLQEPANAT